MKKKTYERKARLYDVLFCVSIAMVLPSYVAGLACAWYQLRTLGLVLAGVSVLTALTAAVAMVLASRL